nr:MAG TPA: hypothetical protein [Caudoviricetes sp.]
MLLFYFFKEWLNGAVYRHFESCIVKRERETDSSL